MKCFVAFCLCLLSAVIFATPTVSSVTARQVQPWNGLVEIMVGLSCESNDLAELDCAFVATNCATLAVLPVSKVRQVGRDTGSGTSWTRHFIWDAAADLGEVKIDDVALTVDAFRGAQLWENGPYWATCNVGASKPEECGYYFGWGDTVGRKLSANNNDWISVKNSESFPFKDYNCQTVGKSNMHLMSEGYIDEKGNLVAAHDAATAYLGAPWRMPTDVEFAALINNCTTTWTTRNEVPGCLVTGKGVFSSKSIFLPATGQGHDYDFWNVPVGFYWSSTPYSEQYSDNFGDAWGMYFGSSDFRRNSCYRFYGQAVRPVRVFAK